MTYPISFQDALAARSRISPFLARTPLRAYRQLDAIVGEGIRVFVKHENHQPTNAFKVRNGLSALTLLTEEERRSGVIAASTGNHGQGVAYAGSLLGAPVTICVPVGNNPEKNEAMRALGAEVVEEGADYDESVAVSERLARERGLTLVHSTNNRAVIAGAATMTLEIMEDAPELDALVIAVGGGSQAVGALTVVRELRPATRVYAV
ncbi:MAG: threonine ammonia-lyase, partial [Gemmatimonadaceae bacterium]